MSYELMRAMIERSQATGSVKAVGIAVASYPPPGTNLAYPSNGTLVDEWGFSERTVQRALRSLEMLGELQRQPRLENAQRPRVYLVDPTFRRQPTLGESCFTEGRQTELDARLTPVMTPVMTPVTSRAPANGREEGKKETPPSPPAERGGARTTSDFAGDGQQQSRVTVRLERAAARRRRRRRGRDDDGASLASGLSCPLNERSDSGELAQLAEAWAQLGGRLREALGDGPFEVWFTGAHLHRADGILELGIAPTTARWVHRRFGLILERCTDHPVELVPCDAANRSAVST